MRDHLFAVVVAGVVAATAASPVLAQQSASFKLTESTLNAGGHPGVAANPTSASHHLTLGSIGDSLASGPVSSASFHLEGGFVSAYPPPEETLHVIFADRQTLRWSPERSAARYNLYRDTLTSLSGMAFGACFQQDISEPMTTDPGVPTIGQGFFYLPTAENRLNEEGTKGFRSNGAERGGTACP